MAFVGLLVTTATRERILATFRETQAAKEGASSFGPLDAVGSFNELQRGMAQGGIAALAALCILGMAARRPVAASAAALLAFTADLTAANARLVMTLPQAMFQTDPFVKKLIEEAERADPSPGPFRIHRMPIWNPIGWYRAESPDRVREFVRWE